MKKKPAEPRSLPSEFSQRALHRGLLAEVIKTLNTDRPLGSSERWFVLHVFESIRDGYDPRTELGVASKSGPRLTRKNFPIWATLYFLKLRETEPDKPVKVHRGIVATATGLSDNSVRDIVCRYRDYCKPLLADRTMRFDTLQNIRDTMLAWLSIESSAESS